MSDTPRIVQIFIGRPSGLDDDPGDSNLVSADDSYTIQFIDDGHEKGFTAQSTCLCALSQATEVWLMGKSEEEVQEVLTGHDRHG